MKIKKKTLLVALAIIIAIGGNICMPNIKKSIFKHLAEARIKSEVNHAERIKDDALAYLGELYDDDFTPLGFTRKNWAYSYDSISFSSAKYGGESFYVLRYTENGEVEFKDSYFALEMQEDAQEKCETIAGMFMGPVVTKAGTCDGYRPPEIGQKATFEDYLEAGVADLYVYYFSNADIPVEQQRQVLTEFIKNKVSGSVTFIVTEDSFAHLEGLSLDDILKDTSLFVKRNDYLINNDYSIKEYEERHYAH